MKQLAFFAVTLVMVIWPDGFCWAEGPKTEDQKANDNTQSAAAQLRPFFQAHCVRCHGDKEPKADLVLERLLDPIDISKDYAVWQNLHKMLDERAMPPEGEPRPAEELVRAALTAIDAELAKFDCRNQNQNQNQKHPGRVTIRRLNRVEYNNTIRDLVGIDFQPARGFPSDDVGHGFDNIGDVLSIPPILLEKYLAAAESIVDRTLGNKTARSRILSTAGEDGHPYAESPSRENLKAFAARAFRRPATEDEMNRIMGLYQLAIRGGGSEEEAFRAALQTMLVSPHFLFRVELDPAPDDADGIRELNDFETAARLSYFLWSSMPDDELFHLAEQGRLRKPGVLELQVQRMLHDVKSRALIKNFAGQWLQLRDLKNMTPDPERYPNFDEELRSAMLRETEMFFETIVREDRNILEFLGADYTFVNERLARHYGIADVKGKEFRRVQLSDQRRGVLTQASILLLTSNPTRTSPVKRGKWILENILGDPPPPPPPNVPELDTETELLGTLRERMEQHRANESCAVCHRQMDTLGFGLENFDGIGAWRDRDGPAAIDPAGTLPGGREFRTPKELMKILSEQRAAEFCRCLTEKMLTYALGRGLQSSDRCAVDEIVRQLKENDYRFTVLVSAIVRSDPFLMREAKRGAH